jgi:single-stranded DNA-binding protein
VEEVQFFTCEAWGKDAKAIADNYKKGSEIVVIGSVKTDEWEKDGQKARRDKIRVSKFGTAVELLGLSNGKEHSPKKTEPTPEKVEQAVNSATVSAETGELVPF